ncbi:MAG: hypothetical protein KY450_09895, partial [Actinobacteria bacterium]|nr:hypothetical protein [Actinomycetota bacterium]
MHQVPAAGSPSPTPLDLRDYLRLIRRRKWSIIITTVGVVGAALAMSLVQTPMYQAAAQLLVQTQAPSSVFDPVTGQRSDPERAVQSEILILESEPVRAKVRERLGSAPDITAAGIGTADGIQVVATSEDPRRAADVANAYAESYIEFRRAQSTETLLDAGEEIGAKIGQFQSELDQLDRQIDDASQEGQAATAERLATRRDSVIRQQALFNQKLDELEVDASIKGRESLLLTPAAVSTGPVSPQPVRNVLLALFVGLLAGGGIAFLREHLDDTIKSKEDVDAALGSVPVLGLVPAVPGWKNRSTPMLISMTDPSSPVAESYRSLRTSIQFLGFDRPLQLIQVTSPSSSEGKTTTLANLAVALAGAGNDVVMVCCDLRRPRLHQFFGLDNSVGLTSVLLGQCGLDRGLQQVPGVDRLKLLASGRLPPNPAEILSSRRAADLLSSLRDRADVVLLDEASARDLVRRLETAPFSVRSTDEKPYTRKPYAPFMTSTLQQEGGRKLRFSAQRVMQ